MGELKEKFGGKASGELIRAADWNGLIDAIETQQEQVVQQVTALGTQIEEANSRLEGLEARSSVLEAFADGLRTRYRRLELSSTRATFAFGERAEVVARVTDFTGASLDLSDAASRPWVDFVTVWGSLKAGPGFASRSGSGGRAVTVQVNADGEARVLLRAEGGDDLGEEQEKEVAAVLDTKVKGRTLAAAFLEEPTPDSSDLEPIYEAVSTAYRRQDTAVMRHYLDAAYLAKSAKAFTPAIPAIAVNWRDEHATVLALVKPDDSPNTSDSAMAVASIRVTFRDWIRPWIVTKFLPTPPALVDDYVRRFKEKAQAVAGVGQFEIMTLIQESTNNKGLLGTQRELAAAQAALGRSPTLAADVALDVESAVTFQRGLLFGQAVTPLLEEDIAPARSFSKAAAQSRTQAREAVATAEARIVDNVRAETARFKNELVSGPLQEAKVNAAEAVRKASEVDLKLNGKAELGLVTRLLNARNPG